MKKVLFTAIAVCAFGFSNAQEVNFGAKLGLNIATFNGDVEDAKSLIGLNVGGFAEIKITDNFSFQPELLYSMQGAKFESKETSTLGNQTLVETSEGKLKFGYLNIPLMAKYYATEEFYFEAGPQVGFLISAKRDFKDLTTMNGIVVDSENKNGEDVKDDFETIDLAMNFGLGYSFTENISVGLRYNLGLSNILKDAEDSKAKNGVFQIGAAYKF